MESKRLGIIVGGGPAPGINAVIGAATIEAINRGFEVIGFFEGFRWLASDAFNFDLHAEQLQISRVARIHFDGGSILRTSRTSLLDAERLKSDKRVAPDEGKVARVVENLKQAGVTHLLTIGGDDTALSARLVTDAAAGAMKLVHCPKTIDNDLPLPHDVSTFGFPTARFIGTELVKNLMADSQTTGRWYICETMGRSSGSLALNIGLAAGATLTLIPEEFGPNSTFAQIVDVIEGAIIKRKLMGRPDGVAILAEGLTYRLGETKGIEAVLGKPVPLDAAGHPRLAEVDLARLVKTELESRFAARGQKIMLVDHEVGYELRSADPTPRDMAYCRSLGYFSILLLLDPDAKPGVMAAMVNGNMQAIDLHDLIDPETNRMRVRTVDIRSDIYRVARAYQIRLGRRDLENAEMLTRLGKEADMTPREFFDRFVRAATRLGTEPPTMPAV